MRHPSSGIDGEIRLRAVTSVAAIGFSTRTAIGSFPRSLASTPQAVDQASRPISYTSERPSTIVSARCSHATASKRSPRSAALSAAHVTADALVPTCTIRPRQSRGGVAGRSSGPSGGGRAGPSQPLGLSSAPSRLLAVARGRAAAGLPGCAVSWRKIGVLTGARGDGLPRLAFGCAAAAKFALLAAGWLHLLVALWARATPSIKLDTATTPEVPSPM